MGNTECITKDPGLDSLCSGRSGYPAFIAPNRENVKYDFDYMQCDEIKFAQGTSGVVSASGYQVEPQTAPGERRISKSYIVKEYTPAAVELRLRISGRVQVHCPSVNVCTGYAADTACAFKVCCRGRPVYQTLRTKSFTHTGQIFTSGIYFGLFISAARGDGLYLRPRIMLVLESGDEVVLVDDKLGPMPGPQTFFADYSILDDGGRNVQMDLILRGLPRENDDSIPDTGMRTLRTCLQEYTAFNHQVDPASVTFGSLGLSSLLPGATVYLQNLVLSEELIDEPAPESRPYGSCRHSASTRGPWATEKVLFEGSDVRAAAVAWDEADASGQALTHPQMLKNENDKEPCTPLSTGPGSPQLRQTWASMTSSAAEEFWHHVRYNDLERRTSDLNFRCNYDNIQPIKGEFWLTRKALEIKNVYFHCSSTLAQAVTMCVAFRFSCPVDFLTFIECRVGSLLETHIPTNGVVLGVERDPRHGALFRMFIEHRNEILEDMVVCECKTIDMARTVVHQEVYDGGTEILYRVTMLHSDGTRQSAVLQLDTEKIEDGRDDRSRLSMAQEPSLRFPIEPCRVYHNLSPVNRIFVYSSSSYEPLDKRRSPSPTRPKEPLTPRSGRPQPGKVPDSWRHMLPQTNPTPQNHVPEGAEDWHSAGGGYSDGEPDAPAGGDMGRPLAGRPGQDGAPNSPLMPGTGNSVNSPAPGECSPHGDAWRPASAWLRPLVESCVLIAGVEEPPFRCFPQNIS